jgi:DNA gyrase/topoisomerase IV subunit A
MVVTVSHAGYVKRVPLSTIGIDDLGLARGGEEGAHLGQFRLHDRLDTDARAQDVEREDMVVTVSHAGYVKRVPLSTYRAQRRGGKGRSGMGSEGAGC